MSIVTNPQPPVVIAARVQPTLHGQLREIAREQDSSLRGEVRRALSAHVNAEPPRTTKAARR